MIELSARGTNGTNGTKAITAITGPRCTISPEDGGRVVELHVSGRQLLVEQILPDPISWGCFPMAPFAGRVRNGRFEFDGKEFQLEINMPPHSIHGSAFLQPWSVSDVSDTFVVMRCGLDDHWPFGGWVGQRIELFDDRLECRLTITADDLAMPAQIGWHPWFVKPDSAQIDFDVMYVRDPDGIPTGELVPSPSGPWDDCFVGPRGPLRLHYGDLVVQVDSDCDHWVIYDEQVRATCVEPQSGPPDGFNSVNAHAFTRLSPGESLERSMTISWHVTCP